MKVIIPLLTALLFGCSPAIDPELRRIASSTPKDGEWDETRSWGKFSCQWPSGIQFGRIELEDGTTVRFAFRSHHLSDGIGMTYFVSGDYERQMQGYFCCELDFGSPGLQSISALDSFINDNDGSKP